MNDSPTPDGPSLIRKVGEIEMCFFSHQGEIIMESHYHTNHPNRSHRKAIPATCGLHRGPIGFANLMVSLQGDSVVLDPHVTGECLITFDEQSATTLRDLLTHWLG
jgi:hypothetical protein